MYRGKRVGGKKGKKGEVLKNYSPVTNTTPTKLKPSGKRKRFETETEEGGKRGGPEQS